MSYNQNENIEILIADNSKESCELLSEYLDGQFSITYASDELEAVNALKTLSKPDLMIINTNIDKPSGGAVFEKIREIYTANELPIVLLTDSESSYDPERSLELGANDYITQPISKQELLTRIKRQLVLSETNLGLERHKKRLGTLIEGIRKISLLRDNFSAMTTAANIVLKEVSIHDSAEVHIYFKEDDLTKEGFARFQFPLLSTKENYFQLSMANLKDIHHDYVKKLPSTIKNISSEQESHCVLQDETLTVFVWCSTHLTGVIQFTGIQSSFDEEDQRFVSSLAQSIGLSLESVALNFNAILAQQKMEELNILLEQRILEQESTEEALRESEQMFRSITISAPVGIFILDPKGRLIYANKRWLAFSGMSFYRALGYGWTEMIHEEDREVSLAKWESSKNEGKEYSQEFRIIKESKEECWGSVRLLRILFEEGRSEGYIGTLEDITERKNAESIMREKVRMEGELKTAAAVQRALFPKELPNIPKLELASFFQSASETGGDWYGFMTQFKNQLYIMIGDVTGHGTPAALVTATASATCRILEAMYYLSYVIDKKPPAPSNILKYLNTAVFESGAPDYLMTFFVARIDLSTGLITYSNAAHNFPIVLNSDGEMQHLLNANSRLGYSKDSEFTENTYQIQTGDTVFFYTDGLIENESPENEMWGERTLIRCLQKNYKLSTQKLIDTVVQKAYKFYNDRPLDDDITIVTCKISQSFPNKPA